MSVAASSTRARFRSVIINDNNATLSFPKQIRGIGVIFQSLDEALLEPYMFTEANLTTYRLVKAPLRRDARVPAGFSELHLAVAMDSILALYHGVKLNFHGKHTCRWTGHSRIHRVLSKVNGAKSKERQWQKPNKIYSLEIQRPRKQMAVGPALLRGARGARHPSSSLLPSAGRGHRSDGKTAVLARWPQKRLRYRHPQRRRRQLSQGAANRLIVFHRARANCSKWPQSGQKPVICTEQTRQLIPVQMHKA